MVCCLRGGLFRGPVHAEHEIVHLSLEAESAEQISCAADLLGQQDLDHFVAEIAIALRYRFDGPGGAGGKRLLEPPGDGRVIEVVSRAASSSAKYRGQVVEKAGKCGDGNRRQQQGCSDNHTVHGFHGASSICFSSSISQMSAGARHYRYEKNGGMTVIFLLLPGPV